MIQDANCISPRSLTIAGVAVASKVWSTAANSIGKKTIEKIYKKFFLETNGGDTSDEELSIEGVIPS